MDSNLAKWNFKEETINKSISQPDKSGTLISEVAPNSPAYLIGMREGDYLISIDGKNVRNQTSLEELEPSEQHRYVIYSSKNQTLTQFSIDPVPLGIMIVPTSYQIVEQLHIWNFDSWDELRLLWERGDWDALLKASNRLSFDGLRSMILRLFFKNFGYTAAMVYKGAALFELGHEKIGIELINNIVSRNLDRYETQEHAIAFYYLAKWHALIDERNQSRKYLAEAEYYNSGDFGKISEEARNAGIAPNTNRYDWLSKTFPTDYSLPIVGCNEMITLSDSLNNMDNDQLLPVCVMPSYRGNGPYNSALLCYKKIFPYLDQKLLPIQIIADNITDDSSENWRYSEESELEKSNIPFNRLYDENLVVSSALKIRVSPVLYLLNNRAEVIYEGSLDNSYDYWKAFALTSQ